MKLTAQSTFLSLLLISSVAEADPSIGYRQVKDVLEEHCLACHSRGRTSGGLDLSTFQTTLAGSDSGAVLVAGDPEDSYLYAVTAHLEEPAMPPGGERIPEEDLLVLRRWIEGGLRERGIAPTEPTPQAAASVEAPRFEASVGSSSEATISKATSVAPTSGFRSPILALAASDSAGLIAVGYQGRVLIYQAEDGQPIGSLPYPEGEPQTLRFGRDGQKLLASGGTPGQSGSVVVWDTNTGNRIHQIATGYDVVLAADLSPKGNRLVLGGPDRLLKLIDARSGETRQTIEKHTGWVLEAAYSPEGLLFATGDRDGGVYVWEAESGTQLHSLRGHKGPITGLAWRQDGNTLFTSSDDGSVRVWDMHTGKPIKRWEAHPSGCLGVAASADTVVTIGRDNRAREWSLSGELIREHPTTSLPTAVASPLGDALVWGDYDGEVRLVRSPAGRQERLPPPRSQSIVPLFEVLASSDAEDSLSRRPSSVESSPPVELEDAVAQVTQHLQSIRHTHDRFQDRLDLIRAELTELGSQPELAEPIDSSEIVALQRRFENRKPSLQRLESACELLEQTVQELESLTTQDPDGQALDFARNALRQALASREAMRAAARTDLQRLEAHEHVTDRIQKIRESVEQLRSEIEQAAGSSIQR